MEEAAAEQHPGPGLITPPATPDIGRKALPLQSAGADGSRCSTLFAPAAAPASTTGFDCVPLSQSTPGNAGEEVCAASTQACSAESESSDKIAPSGEATAANAIPTPTKVEHTPWRPRKKSTKGMTRLKVKKDIIIKDKLTPKAAATPPKVQNPRISSEHMEDGIGKSSKRKLDFDSPEVITGSFSRARLMENLRCLAKINGFSNGMSGKKGKKSKTSGQLAIIPYQNPPTDASSSALVLSGNFKQLAMVRYGSHVKNVRPKVLGLDDKTLQVYDVLMDWDKTDSETFEGLDIGSGPYWDEIRQRFEHMVDFFIATVEDLFGPREFSRWGGSVIDSVVGTYLTQNVADNLSSDAFMKLVAKFPVKKRRSRAEGCSYVPLLMVDGKENLNLNQGSDVTDFVKSGECDNEVGYIEEVKGQYGPEYKALMESFIAYMKEKDISTWESEKIMNLVKDKSGKAVCTERTLRKFIATLQLKDTSHWDNLREEACKKGYNMSSATRISDSVDWEAVLHASPLEVAKCIAGRGQHYLLTCRIQAFLARIKKDHGNFDLDWLRYVPRERAKDFLLSVNGLGAKSVDCIRLLSLEHKAFPVDVNVARIVTRLGWVELQSLPYSAEFHSVNLYPIMQDVQKYLWPRLCTIDKEKLYELHCLMITFGKVICTKVNPNCSACPFRAKCKYYNSSFKRASLPPAEEQEHHQQFKEQTSMVASERLLLSNGSCMPSQEVYQHEIEISRTAERQPARNCEPIIEVRHEIEISRTAERQPARNCEPIIEVPPSPEYEYEEAFNEEEQNSEDDLTDIEDIVPGVQYDAQINLCSGNPMVNKGSWTPNYGKDLALTNSQHTFYPSRKLKNIGRLRTEHHAYVLPDDHAILEEFEERVPEDPCPYLLVVSHPDDHMVKGTYLIPCRTATGGNFPLNGTYFQDHEVFADYASSRSPIIIPRECIWNLERRIVYFGSSIHSITKGQTKQDIQDCFKKGYICVRGFDRRTRYPMRLCASLHVTNKKKESDEKEESDETKERGGNRSKVKTSPQGKSGEKVPSAN